MAAETTPIPEPCRHDIEDVQCALAVSAARWEHGDFEDSLRWLRRAARAAADHEQLERALELSKVAARMAKRLSQPPPPPRRSQPVPRSNPIPLGRRSELPPAPRRGPSPPPAPRTAPHATPSRPAPRAPRPPHAAVGAAPRASAVPPPIERPRRPRPSAPRAPMLSPTPTSPVQPPTPSDTARSAVAWPDATVERAHDPRPVAATRPEPRVDPPSGDEDTQPTLRPAALQRGRALTAPVPSLFGDDEVEGEDPTVVRLYASFVNDAPPPTPRMPLHDAPSSRTAPSSTAPSSTAPSSTPPSNTPSSNTQSSSAQSSSARASSALSNTMPSSRPPSGSGLSRQASNDTLPETPASAPLTAARVAVMRDPDTGRPTLTVLSAGAPAPRGSAVAMLVGASPEDMMRLAELLEHSVTG